MQFIALPIVTLSHVALALGDAPFGFGFDRPLIVKRDAPTTTTPPLFTGPPGLTPTLPQSCTDACGGIDALTCSDAACICPTVFANGPVCSACIAFMAPGQAATIGAGISACEQILTTSIPLSTLPPPICTQGVCSGILSAIGQCKKKSCICDAIISSGSACSDCLVSATDTIDAAFVGMLNSYCATATIATSAGATPTTMATITAISNSSSSSPSSSSNSSASVASKSGAQRINIDGSFFTSHLFYTAAILSAVTSVFAVVF